MEEPLINTPCRRHGNDHRRDSPWLGGVALRWFSKPGLIALVSLAWILIRVIPKPARARYPCQRMAMNYVALYFAGSMLPARLAPWHRWLTWLATDLRRAMAVALALTVSVLGYRAYAAQRLVEFRQTWSAALPVAVAEPPKVPSNGIRRAAPGGAAANRTPAAVGTSPSLVSVGYDPAASYGSSIPYDRGTNPAYDLVWQAVAELHLGAPENPLAELISPGDRVLIKINMVNGDTDSIPYTHPAVVRPLVDMAVLAGAKHIQIGDGGIYFTHTNEQFQRTGYDELVNRLAELYPGVTLELVNFNESGRWRWVNLESQSSFAGSGYTDADLGDSRGQPLADSTYYSTPDAHGLNPGGHALGWYAMSTDVLEADVIINVPKLKVHPSMIMTGAIKNHVGSLTASTYGEDGWIGGPRIAHRRYPGEDAYFADDIFWRAILDANKIVLFADRTGALQSTQQRGYLNVLDAILAAEQGHFDSSSILVYKLGAILAGQDPVALDAVASRLMGYDFRAIPQIAKTDAESAHSIGTDDPTWIAIVGEEIDARFEHVFVYNPDWGDKAASAGLPLTDFEPPTISAAQVQDAGANDRVTMLADGADVGFVRYTSGGSYHFERMSRAGSEFALDIPDGSSQVAVIAQDVHLNSSAEAVGVGPSFADVPTSHWAYTDIEKLFQGGFVVGCQTTPVRKYCPEGTLTRAEAAVFVERGVHGGGYLPPQPTSTPFDDVPLLEWYAKWVKALWDEGFTAGCGTSPLRFCPNQGHTRAEATVFFLRMLRGKDYLPPEPSSVPYEDVALGTWYAKWVAAAFDADLTQDCEDPVNRADNRFRPEENLTRAEAACMMVRARETTGGGLPVLRPNQGNEYRISLANGNTHGNRFVFGDLDGDGLLDPVVKSGPRDDGFFYVEAYNYSGTRLWSHNTGITPETTADASYIHEIVLTWDLDATDGAVQAADGRWEVIYNYRQEGGGWGLRIVEGQDGSTRREIEWPAPAYSGHDRHYGTIAYLDGKNPYIVVSAGLYDGGSVYAYDRDLNLVWQFDYPRATGAHWLSAYDFNGDGRDEIVYGGTTINSDGTKRWGLPEISGDGHVDMAQPGDLIPNNGTAEVFYCAEQWGATLMVDSNGKLLWRDDQTDFGGHCHTGWAANVDPNLPGDESCAHGRSVGNACYDAFGNPWGGGGDRPYDANGDGVYRGGRADAAGDLDGDGGEENWTWGSGEVIVVFGSPGPSPRRWGNRGYMVHLSAFNSGYTPYEFVARDFGPTFPVRGE